MKVRKNTYVKLDDGRKVYVLKGTNKENGFIHAWDIKNRWDFGICASHVVEICK